MIYYNQSYFTEFTATLLLLYLLIPYIIYIYLKSKVSKVNNSKSNQSNIITELQVRIPMGLVTLLLYFTFYDSRKGA